MANPFAPSANSPFPSLDTIINKTNPTATATPAPAFDFAGNGQATTPATTPFDVKAGSAYNYNVPAVTKPPQKPNAAPTTVPTINFLDGSKYTATGKQISPPTVVTGKSATEDLVNKKAALDQAAKAQADQQAKIAVDQANTQVTPEPAKPVATADDLDKIINGTTGEEGAKKANDAIQAVQDQADATFLSFMNQIKQIQQGTFPLTPSQQAQIQATQNSFAQAKTQQELVNKNFEAQIRLSGITSGRNMTAPQVNLGMIKNAVDNGISKIAYLDNQAALAVSSLQQGFMDKDYAMINDAYTAASNLFHDKSQAIQEMNTNVRNATQDALALHKQQVDEAQQQLTNQRTAIDFAVKNNITKPFYLVGNTAIDSKTGLPIDLPTYQKMTGQQVGLPESQTDFSQIQHIEDPAIKKLRDDYPDAGILPTDTMATAQAKLHKSALYRKATYIAPVGGPSGGIKISYPTINGKVTQLITDARGNMISNTPLGQAGTVTDTQRATAIYANRTNQANDTLKGLEGTISSYNPVGFETQLKLPSFLQSSNIKQFNQASRNFVNAVLRRESGAVISSSEFDNAYQQYLPKPGDDTITLQQKAQNRQTVIEGLSQASNGLVGDISADIPAGNVAVIAPDGTPGYIPQDQLNEALSSGYVQQ